MHSINCKTEHANQGDPAAERYRKNRMSHWEAVSPQKSNFNRPGAYYHQLLRHYYKFLIPPGLRILELGCGHGELLASLKPAFGCGLDFSEAMVQEASKKYSHLHFLKADAHNIPIKMEFDVIILSDLVNDLWDVQRVFEKVRSLSHPGTRLVLNFFNNLWRIPLYAAKLLGLGANVMEQNWFSPQDIHNLLTLSGFDVVHRRPAMLLPLKIPVLAECMNRYLTHLPILNWFALTNFIIARPDLDRDKQDERANASVSIIIPTRNEAGNIETILKKVPELGRRTELVFVEGHSSDKTYETIEELIPRFSARNCKLLQQSGAGKGDAVRLGFAEAEGDILMILDADMTVPPEDLQRFFNAIVGGRGEFINGVRLVYPLEDKAMRFFNILGNKFFSLAFSWLLGQPIKDTLCGTKVLWKRDYQTLSKNRDYFGEFDPFGDFDLLFGAAKHNLKIAEMPIRYRSRTYGDTNIDRWRHGWLLLKMVVFAARRIKFI
jgi:SAM-dependent methyltransferase